LMRMAVGKGRSVRENLKIGICGEHGGDPSSVEFCHMIGLDYVSCSPFRVPIARLAAARASLMHGKEMLVTRMTKTVVVTSAKSASASKQRKSPGRSNGTAR